MRGQTDLSGRLILPDPFKIDTVITLSFILNGYMPKQLQYRLEDNFGRTNQVAITMRGKI